MSESDSDRSWKPGGGFRQNFDPGNFGFARSFRRHGGMKYYVLWLLSQRPLKGSEIMDEIQKQTMGWWKPSPGTVYPLLSGLEHDGLVRRLEDLRYELTDSGAELIGLRKGAHEKHRDGSWDIENILTEMEGYASYLEEEKNELSDYEDRIQGIIDRLKKLKTR